MILKPAPIGCPLMRCFQGVGVTFVLLYLFEDTGLLNVACGLATCALAYLVIKQFPDIDMVSPQFIGLVG